MFVLIIDYGSGNIKSVYNSVKKTIHNFNKFSEVKVSRNLSEIEKADKIILPGVGSFDQCMNRIRKIKDLVETLKDQVITKKKPCKY
jgi:glutamine amidotransferase